ncbi:MAG: DUF3048 domain-containing protein [Acetivibrionales bacterium]|jgi:hypothetical protein
MIKRTILLLLLSGVLVFVSACGGATDSPVASPAETPSATPEITPEPELPVEDPVFNPDFILPDSSMRPVAAMIDNQGDRVLPQGGISQAQIIYEILVEYNITRYMAVFWGTLPDMVGPIRSSRHYFLDYVLEHDAIYNHAGGSTYAYKDIPKLKIQNIDYQVHGSAFWDLTTDKSNWQDSYTSRERIEKFIADKKYRTESQKAFPFTYHDQFMVPENGTQAEDISIKFDTSKGSSNCGFVYNPGTRLYDRFRMGKPHMERNTNEQVKTTNIIVIQISSPLIKGDTYGRRNLNNIGSGDGYYITGGKAIPIKWEKTARAEQTKYTTEDGKPLVLNRGQTWIEIVQKLEYVTIE